MSKKRVIFTLPSLVIGGTEKALLGLLSAIDYNRFDVDLFLFRHEGEFMNLLPKGVNLLPELEPYKIYNNSSTLRLLLKGYFGIAFGRKIAKYKHRRFVKRLADGEIDYSFTFYQMQAISHYLPPINPDVEYDAAISFTLPVHPVAHKIRAKRRISWLHADLKTRAIDAPHQQSVMSLMDHIVSISPLVSEGFAYRFPSLADRVVRIDHQINREFIVAQAAIGDMSQIVSGNPSICTIARICTEKNLLGAIQMCAIIARHHPDVRWYVVGGRDNTQYPTLVDDKIKELGMENHFILLGSQTNPYPYIAACDLYIQPSLSEAKSIAVIEAQMLHKPVIITAYTTANSQLRDGIDGIVVPLDSQQAAEGIMALMENKELQDRLVESCKATEYSTQDEMERFYTLIP